MFIEMSFIVWTSMIQKQVFASNIKSSVL
jgi:hypothetical protein